MAFKRVVQTRHQLKYRQHCIHNLVYLCVHLRAVILPSGSAFGQPLASHPIRWFLKK